MEKWNDDDLKAMLGQVEAKAASDPQFRKLAVSDPAKAIKQVTGRDVPAGTTLKLVEQGASLGMSVVHQNLDDAALAQVTGGVCAAIGGKCPCGSGSVLTLGCGHKVM